MGDPKITTNPSLPGRSRAASSAAVTDRTSVKPPDAAAVGKDKPSAAKVVDSSGLHRGGRPRRSSFYRKNNGGVTPSLSRRASNSVLVNHNAAARTMTGEHMMLGLGAGHNATQLLLELLDNDSSGQSMMQLLANIGQGIVSEDYAREFKEALAELVGKQVYEATDTISRKLASSDINTLRWRLASAAQSEGSGSIAARMNFMLEELCSQFKTGKMQMPQDGSEDMGKQLDRIFNQIKQAYQHKKGSLNAVELQNTRLSYDLDQGHLQQFSEGSRKGVCQQFRDKCAGCGNIFKKGHSHPINGESIKGNSKAGSKDLIDFCGNKQMSLAASRAIAVLQNPQAAGDIFGPELSKMLPLPEVGHHSADNVTFSSTKQRFELEKDKERGVLKMRIRTDAVLDVAASKNKNDGISLETKLNPARSNIAVNLDLEINAKGEVKIAAMDYDYRAQPVIGIEVEDQATLMRRAKDAVMHKPQAHTSQPVAPDQPPERRKLPPTPTAAEPFNKGLRKSMRARASSISHAVVARARSLSVSAGLSSGKTGPTPAANKSPDKVELSPADASAASKSPDKPELPLAGAPAASKPSDEIASRPEILDRESDVWIGESSSNDVLSGIAGMNRLFSSLNENNVNAAADALQALAGSGVLADASSSERGAFFTELSGYVTRLSHSEAEQLSRAIGSPEMNAVRDALAMPSTLTGNKMIQEKMKHVAYMIDQIRNALGKTYSRDLQSPSDSDRKRADAVIRKFVSAAEKSVSEIEYEPLGEQLNKRFSPEELGTLRAADPPYDCLCRDLLDEVVDGNYRIMPDQPDGVRKPLVNLRELSGQGIQKLRQTLAENLLALCGDRRQQTLSLSRVLAKETGEMIKPAFVELGAVQPDPPLAFSLQVQEDGSIEVTVDCQCALRKYDPDGKDKQGRQLNPNFSSWNGQLRLQVATDGTVTPAGDSRRAVLVNRSGEVSDFVDYQVAKQPGDQNLQGLITTLDDLKKEQNKQIQEMEKDPQLIRENMTKLHNNNVVNADKVSVVDRWLHNMDEMQRRIEEMTVAGLGKQSDVVRKARDHIVDLELMFAAADQYRNTWPQGSIDDVYTIQAIMDALKLRMSSLKENLQWFVEKVSLDKVLANQQSPAARIAAARRQTEAAYAAVVESFADALDSGRELEDNQTALLTELAKRRHAIIEDERRVQAGQKPLHDYGLGVNEKDFDMLGRNILKELKAYKSLPAAHEHLSEEQLVQLRVQNFMDENLEFRPFFENFVSYRAAHSSELDSGQDWGKIRKRFIDNPGGSVNRVVESRITPAARFEEERFAANYGGINVGIGSHFSGVHAVNLAHSQLAVGQGGVRIYSGLRHGIFDNHLMIAERLRTTSRGILSRLYNKILSKNRAWQDWAKNNNGGSWDKDLPLLRSDEGSKLAVSLLRRESNLNAAQEVIRAAVVSDPQLLAKAQRGEKLEIAINAISMITPDDAAADRKEDDPSAEQLLEEHRSSLQQAARWPIMFDINDADGKVKKVEVTARVRSINCEIHRSDISRTQPQTGSDDAVLRQKAEKENRQQLEDMIGPFAAKEIGGAAADKIAELEKNADTPDADTAFATQGDRADAIRKLASQIKSIFASAEGRSPVNDPYYVASRLALLSFLLGDCTAVSCETGIVRSGNLDAQVKHLAATMASKTDLDPESQENRLRRANFLLRTGNSEFHWAASGGRFGHQADSPFPLSSMVNDSDVRASMQAQNSSAAT